MLFFVFLIFVMIVYYSFKYKKSTLAYAISNNFDNNWRFVSIINDRCYFIDIDDNDLEYGNIYEVYYDSIKNILTKVKKRNVKGDNELIFFGEGFNVGDSIIISLDNKINKRLDLTKGFGVKYPFCKKINLKIYRESSIFSEYDFNFELNSDINFHTFEIEPPKSRVLKEIYFDKQGKCNFQVRKS